MSLSPEDTENRRRMRREGKGEVIACTYGIPYMDDSIITSLIGKGRKMALCMLGPSMWPVIAELNNYCQ